MVLRAGEAVRANRHPGKCCECNRTVPAGAGTLAQRPDRWDTVCHRTPCNLLVYGQDDAPNPRVLRADGTIPLPEKGPDTPLLNAIATWDQSAGVWRVSQAIADRELAIDICERLELHVQIPLALWRVPLSQYCVQTKVAIAKAAATCNGRIYQIDGTTWLAAHDRGLLADDMGLGKTKQVLDALPDNTGVLIVCPAVAKGVWLREIGKWCPDRFDDVVVCEGWGSFQWPEHARQCVIVNYDLIPPQASELKNAAAKIAEIEAERAEYLAKFPWADPMDREWWRSSRALTKAWSALYRTRDQGAGSAVGRTLATVRDILRKTPTIKKPRAYECEVTTIFDEVHKLKSNKALQTKRCRVISRFSARCYGLSGTPIENHPLELWGVLTSIKCRPPHWSGENGWFAFLDAFGGWRKPHGGFDFEVDDGGAIVVKPGTTGILRRVMLRRTKRDVGGQLPEVTFGELPVPLTPELVEQLEELEPEIRDALLADKVPDIAGYARLRKALATSRIAAMMEVVKSYEESGTPLLVFSAHRAPILRLGKRKGWFGVTGSTSASKRTEFEDRFQAGEGVGFCGTIKSMGVAITLTRAAHVLMVDQELTPSKNAQAVKRADRIGQTANVHVTIMYSDHPLDQAVSEMLVRKSKLFDRTLHGEYKP